MVLFISVRKVIDFLDFLFSQRSLIVKVLLYQTIGVQVVVMLFSLEFCNQTVKFTNQIQQSLFSMADVLEHFLPIDAVVEIDVDEGLSKRNVV